MDFYVTTMELVNFGVKFNTSGCQMHLACSIKLHKLKISVKAQGKNLFRDMNKMILQDAEVI